MLRKGMRCALRGCKQVHYVRSAHSSLYLAPSVTYDNHCRFKVGIPAVNPHQDGACAVADEAYSWSPLSGDWSEYVLSQHQHHQLETFLDYLLEINKVMNLTAVRNKVEARERHVGDSLALLPIIDRHLQHWPTVSTSTASNVTSVRGEGMVTGGGSSSSNASALVQNTPTTSVIRNGSKHAKPTSGSSATIARGNVRSEAAGRMQADTGSKARFTSPAIAEAKFSKTSSSDKELRVIDVGTGAGLPGMILAVARPRWKVTLLDTLRKRCDFLHAAAHKIGLNNVEVIWSRAEDAGQDRKHREVYDLAIARAVAETRVLAELCLPFVALGGLWVAAKGPDPEAEVTAAAGALKQLGGQLLGVNLVASRSNDGQRTAVAVRKSSVTPSRFPRQAGTPAKKPL